MFDETPIDFREQKYVIETKIFTTDHYFQKGKRQFAEYVVSEGLEEGYYVVFSNKHTETEACFRYTPVVLQDAGRVSYCHEKHPVTHCVRQPGFLKHAETDQLDFAETIHGKRILTYIICTHFERATDLAFIM